jgi:nitrite reductase/ring-hydroxylating ferredoxin subunit
MVQVHQLFWIALVLFFHAFFIISSHAFLPVALRLEQLNHHHRSEQQMILSAAGKGMGQQLPPPPPPSGKGMGKKPSSSSSTATTPVVLNWCPTPISVSDIPTQDSQVVILETQLPSLQNGATNPNGAIAVTKYNGQTYCFRVSCPACQIPLNQAVCSTIPDPDDPQQNIDVLSCNFCKTSYDLDTGKRLTKPAVPPGLFGSIAHKLFSSQPGMLKFYKLGEKGGKVLISLD